MAELIVAGVIVVVALIVGAWRDRKPRDIAPGPIHREYWRAIPEEREKGWPKVRD